MLRTSAIDNRPRVYYNRLASVNFSKYRGTRHFEMQGSLRRVGERFQ